MYVGVCGGNTMSESPKEYKQKLVTLHARMKYREKAIQDYKRHLKNGTFPKRFKSLKPYPAMECPEAQARVNEACQQVEKVMLEQRIQDFERKLLQDRASLQTLKDTRRQQRQQPKKTAPTMLQLQQELKDLQTKYKELAQKVVPQEA